MLKTEAWVSDNGQLDKDPKRAKANDIAYALGNIAREKAIGTSGVSQSKVDWHAALELLENAALVIGHLQEYLELRRAEDAEKAREAEEVRQRESQLSLAVGADIAGETPEI